MANLIVTRHIGLVEYLSKKGITGNVISHATPEDVRGKDVYGVLPLYLAALAKSIVSVDLPNLSPDQWGLELTEKDMENAGAVLHKYVVKEVALNDPI